MNRDGRSAGRHTIAAAGWVMGLLLMSAVEQPTWAKIDIVFDYQAHFKVIFGVGARHFVLISFGMRFLLLHFQEFCELATTLAGLEQGGRNEKTLEVPVVFLFFVRFDIGERH